jgi:hypothetical protein
MRRKVLSSTLAPFKKKRKEKEHILLTSDVKAFLYFAFRTSFPSKSLFLSLQYTCAAAAAADGSC